MTTPDDKPPTVATPHETALRLLEAGLSHVEIWFGRTWDRTAGIVVSLTTVLVFFPLVFWIGEREIGAKSRELEQADARRLTRLPTAVRSNAER